MKTIETGELYIINNKTPKTPHGIGLETKETLNKINWILLTLNDFNKTGIELLEFFRKMGMYDFKKPADSYTSSLNEKKVA